MPTEKEREYRRKYDLAAYYKSRSEILSYLGGKCVECGSIENLEVHHIDPKLKEFDIAGRWGWPWDKIVGEIDKCELRCKKHHLKMHEAKHGTSSKYGAGCRCIFCVKAWNADCLRYQKASRDRKRIQEDITGDRRSGQIWITNGSHNSKIRKTYPIPEGWRRGRFVKADKDGS